MKAADVKYQVGDRVSQVAWGIAEFGTVVNIPDGEDVFEVVVHWDDNTFSVERPQDVEYVEVEVER